MKTNLKENFIELRIKGESLEKIASELNVTKQTLINWSKEDIIKQTIKAGLLVKYQALIKLYELDRQSKIEFYAEFIKKAKSELNKREFQDIKVEKLINIIGNCEDRLKELIPIFNFGSENDFNMLGFDNLIINPID